MTLNMAQIASNTSRIASNRALWPYIQGHWATWPSWPGTDVDATWPGTDVDATWPGTRPHGRTWPGTRPHSRTWPYRPYNPVSGPRNPVTWRPPGTWVP